MRVFGVRGLCAGAVRGKRLHAALAHSTWFRVAEQGMREYEVLAQGSAFLARAPGGALFALLSAHVAAPHRWRRYFAADFLDHVTDAHCESRLQRRSACGAHVTNMLMVAPLRDGFAEAVRDVAAFHVDDACDVPVLQLLDGPVPDGAQVAVHGHVLRGMDGADGIVPTIVDGEVIAKDGPRVFVDTSGVDCEMGMCGGPVILENGTCAGILEGVVPRIEDGKTAMSDLHARIAGCAALISAQELCPFLADVEKAVQGPDGKIGGHGTEGTARGSSDAK